MMALIGLLNAVGLEILGVILEAIWIYCTKNKGKKENIVFILLLTFFLSWILGVNYLSSDLKKMIYQVKLDTVCHLLWQIQSQDFPIKGSRRIICWIFADNLMLGRVD